MPLDWCPNKNATNSQRWHQITDWMQKFNQIRLIITSKSCFNLKRCTILLCFHTTNRYLSHRLIFYQIDEAWRCTTKKNILTINRNDIHAYQWSTGLNKHVWCGDCYTLAVSISLVIDIIRLESKVMSYYVDVLLLSRPFYMSPVSPSIGDQRATRQITKSIWRYANANV